MSASPTWSGARGAAADRSGDEWEAMDDGASPHHAGGSSSISGGAGGYAPRKRFRRPNGEAPLRQQRGSGGGFADTRSSLPSSGGGGGAASSAGFFSPSPLSLNTPAYTRQRYGSGDRPHGTLPRHAGRRRGSGSSSSGGGAAGEEHSGSGAAARFSRPASRFASSAMSMAQLSAVGPLSTHLLDWRVPSLSAEQELLQQVFATAYTDACYRCLLSQDAAHSFRPNETLQLVVDQWRADLFDESQDTLRRVVEQYHHDLLHVVKAVVDAEDAALAAQASEVAGAGGSMAAAVSLSGSVSGPSAMDTSSSSDPSLYQAFMSVGQATIPATIDCPVIQKAALHYAMPALGRVVVHQGFFLCFWYTTTGERLGQLEHRACRWVLEAHVPHVHVPLCYHIRYKGRGVTAMSLTPIGDNLTTVTEQNPEVAALAQQLASVFSLLPYGSAPGPMGPATTAAASAGFRSAASMGSHLSSPLPFTTAASTSVDGEVQPDVSFLPRSVQVHFAQDGRYYFLRNSQWFAPWLNSRQACDAAAQRLSFLNPRLLAMCGAQVSCRACRRDAFMEENRVALEFMRHEIDVGIPRLLHDEQGSFVHQVLRQRRRVAVRRLRGQRAARRAQEREASRQSTAVRVGGGSQSGERRRRGSSGGSIDRSHAATSAHSRGSEEEEAGEVADADRGGDDSEWTSDGHSDADGSSSGSGSDANSGAGRHDSDDDDGEDEDGASAFAMGGRGGAVPLSLLPFTTTSVVGRFSARGYPKSFLGVLLLALLQYPAAPTHMIREVKREMLFRGLKAFIRMRTYEARFGVEQLLGRLPHERTNEDDFAPDGADASAPASEEEEEDDGEPIHDDATAAAAGGRSTGGKRGKAQRAAEAATSAPAAAAPASAVSNPFAAGMRDAAAASAAAAAGAGNNSSSRFAYDRGGSGSGGAGVAEGERDAAAESQPWRSRQTAALHVVAAPSHANSGSDAMARDGATAGVQQGPQAAAGSAESASEPLGFAARLWRRTAFWRPRWLGGGDGHSEQQRTSHPHDGDGAGTAGNVLEGDSTARLPSHASPSPPRPRGGGGGSANPLAALHGADHSLSGTANAPDSGSRSAPASPARAAQAASWMQSAAASTFFLSWAEFAVTAERVLSAFMQYDGSLRPTHVFCDSTRRLDELEELRERERCAWAAAGGDENSTSASSSSWRINGVRAGGNSKDSARDVYRALRDQRREYEATLWSSADMLNRLYVEQIVPFIYRKFRLSVQRVDVLYEPLSEEDRVSVYVRLLDALGITVEDGEVREVVPVVRDFSPRRAAARGSDARLSRGADGTGVSQSGSSSREGRQPPLPPSPSQQQPQQHGSGDNPLGRSGTGVQTSTVADTAAHAGASGSAARRAGGGDDSAAVNATRAERQAAVHSDPLSPPRDTARTPKQRHPVRSASSPSSSSPSSPVSRRVRSVKDGGDVVDGIVSDGGNGAASPPRSADVPQHYLLPNWVVCRARGLVQSFLASLGEAAGPSTTSATAHKKRRGHSARSSRRTSFEVDVNVVSTQVAGLLPFLAMFYSTPSTAFPVKPRRRSLPPWPQVAARLLAQLRSVSMTPHLLWDALELYELVDLRTLMEEFDADGTLALSRPAAPATPTTTSSTAAHRGPGSEDEGDHTDASGGNGVRPRRSSAAWSIGDSFAEHRHSGGTTGAPALPPPRCSLALALLLRRRTLRSTSDRTILIQVLRRYVAAIPSSPELLCFLAPLHGDGGQAASGSLQESGDAAHDDGDKDGGASVTEPPLPPVGARCGTGESTFPSAEAEAVYTAVLSTLQEVLLNADLLLSHFGNPFGAQYRQYTADLVGYLEYNMHSFAATVPNSALLPLSPAAGRRHGPHSSPTPPGHPHHHAGGGEARWWIDEPARRLRGLREELEATLHHIWSCLNTYCKADSMAARDAMQRAVALYRMHEAGAATHSAAGSDAAIGESSGSLSASGSGARPESGMNHRGAPQSSQPPRPPHSRGQDANEGSNSNNSSALDQSATAADPSTAVALSRDTEVEASLRQACELFLLTEGTSSPVTLRAYCNMALYWYSVGCDAEWREWMQRLRRLWCEGGPEDVRQLLMATSTVKALSVTAGNAGYHNSSYSVNNYNSSIISGVAGGGSVAESVRLAGSDAAGKAMGSGQSGAEAGLPIPFLQLIPSD